MLRTALGALVALVALAAPVPPASADPAATVLSLQATIGCFGCGTYGPDGNSLDGVALVGDGPIRTGASISGSFTVDEPTGATCVVSGHASGRLETSDGYVADFTFTHSSGGSSWAVDGYGPGAGTFAITSPLGNPCGGPAVVRMHVTLGGLPTAPPARGHITIHRFPQSSGALGGVRLWAAPVAPNGVAWQCRDIHTGAVVVERDLLTSPDPGVSCVPPVTYSDDCDRVDAGGYHADAGLGTVTVTSTCGAVSASATIKVPMAWVTVSRSAYGNGATPWTCQATESLANAAETDYWVFCDANLP